MSFLYSYLTLNVFLIITKPFGCLAAKVSISQNITGLIGNNDISLTCSFTYEALEQVVRVQFFAKNKTDEFDLTRPISIFDTDKPARLLSSGNYLNDRVTMTNLTSTSTNATLTFLVLKCEDEKYYLCQCYSVKEGAFLPPEKSPPTRISVQATSLKPDSISSITVLSSKKQTKGYGSSLYNATVTTNKYDILNFRASSIDTVTTTNLQSTEKPQLVFHEGDTVMFTCTGDIGRPPGKLIWQKTLPQGKKRITYSNETTDIEEIVGKCSFKGTSHLTVKIDAEDINTKIRCFEESHVHIPSMYQETEPFDVQFQINHLDISKQPIQNRYDQNTDNITLTCKGNGNPIPTYVWFKKGQHSSILSNKSFYVIENVKRNKSGVYICEGYNIIEDIRYRKSNSVEIYIVDEDELPSSQESTLLTTFIEYVVPVICVALFIGIFVAVITHYCIRQSGKKQDENYYQTFSHDGITVNSEYASVTHTNNTTAVETADNMVCYNCKEANKNKSRNNAFGLAVVYDEVDQQTTMKYKLSKIGTPGQHDTVKHEVSTGSSKNEGASGETAVYEEIDKQETLKYDVKSSNVTSY